MVKKNCWEARQCDRQPGGSRARQEGICPASTLMAVNGVNGGVNGGRACWALTGTMSGPAGKVQASFARNLSCCCACRFYEQVLSEEGENFEGTVKIVKKLRDRIAKAAMPQPGAGDGTG